MMSYEEWRRDGLFVPIIYPERSVKSVATSQVYFTPHLRNIGAFSIDAGFVEDCSLCAGRMASRSFSKTVRHRQESAVSAM